MKRTVIVFGGTFDPPHRAHTQLPPLIAESVEAETILYVIAALSPFKSETPPTPAHHRLAMLRLATADIPKAEICEIELSREGPSFTINTLEALRHHYAGDVDLRLLIGADQAMAFNHWRDWRQILEIAPPLIMLRPPHSRDALLDAISKFSTPEELSTWRSWIIPLDLIDLSATELRDEHERATLPPDSLTPEVRQYIDAHGLYADK
ncbi:MAG: nicotinate (nicotinamide) nucleotide adenylyltransferase [Phycisphaerales bacterium]|nr:nicotinate (nicotinamide) nucleotide adenylyltransferase [Phycisphaerales bacterium]